MTTTAKTDELVRPARPIDANNAGLFQITYFLDIWRDANQKLSQYRTTRAKQFLPVENVMASDTPGIPDFVDAFKLADQVVIDEVFALVAQRFVAGADLLITEEDAYTLANDIADDDRVARRYLEDRLLLEVTELNNRLMALGGNTQAAGLRHVINGILTVSSRRSLLPTELSTNMEAVYEVINLTDAPNSMHQRFNDSPLRTADGYLRYFFAPMLRLGGHDPEAVRKLVSELRADETFLAHNAANETAQRQVLDELIARIWPQFASA